MKLDSKKLTFSEFEVDVDRRRLFRAGAQISLNAKTFDLLVALLSKPGEVIEKDELLNLVWDGQFVEEGNLAVHVSRLRKILGESKNENEFIATIPGRGYSFVADVAHAAETQSVIHNRSFTQVVVEEEILEDDRGLLIGEDGPDATKRVRAKSRSRLFIAGLTISIATLCVAGYFLLSGLRASSEKFTFRQIEIKQLTSSGNIANAAISREGNLIVYSESIGEEESLWLAHSNGGEKVLIRPAAAVIYQNLQFSPDGNLIYYTAGSNFSNASLYKVSTFGGSPPLKIRDNVRRFSLSPDGKHVVIVDRGADGASVLISITTDGVQESIVATLSDTVAQGWTSPAWSPDGRKVAVAGGTGPGEMGLFIVGLENGAIERLGNFSWQAVRGLSWLNDGGSIVAVGVAPKTLLAQVWQTAYPDGETRRVTSDLVDYVFATSVTDDNSIAAVAEVSQSNVWVAPADDLKDAKQVTFSSAGARIGWLGLSWAPDGRILYSSDANDGTTIWSMNADGSQKKQIIANGGVNSSPTIGADGKFVVVQSNRNGHYAIWRTDANGENMVQLSGDRIAAQPFVSPDGKWVIYNSNESGLGELFRISIEGGPPIRLTNLQVGWAQVSPDSRSVAGSALIDGIHKLVVFPIEGGDTFKVFDLPRLYNVRGGIRWTPDGRSLVYRDWKNGLWRQSLDGGSPTLIPGLPEEKLGNFGWSFDGKYFAYTRIATSRDVVLIASAR